MKMFRVEPQRVWPFAVGQPFAGEDAEAVLRQLPHDGGNGVGHPPWVIISGPGEWHARESGDIELTVSGGLSREQRSVLVRLCEQSEKIALFAASSTAFAFRGVFGCEYPSLESVTLTSRFSSDPTWIPLVPELRDDDEARIPFEVDPEELDRKRREHQEMVVALNEEAMSRGLAVSKLASVPVDLGWFSGSIIGSGEYTIVEVKTVNRENANKQLRLAISQVLDYEAAIELFDDDMIGRTHRLIVLSGDSGELSLSLLRLLEKHQIDLFLCQGAEEAPKLFR
jgi:hypothetical protein